MLNIKQFMLEYVAKVNGQIMTNATFQNAIQNTLRNAPKRASATTKDICVKMETANVQQAGDKSATDEEETSIEQDEEGEQDGSEEQEEADCAN